MAYVMPPVTKSCGCYRVKEGDSLGSICLRHGRPAWAYDELIAANQTLLGPRGFSGSSALGYTAPIRVGDELNLPRWWKPCQPCGLRAPAPSLGLVVDPGEIKEAFKQAEGQASGTDVALDPVTVRILKLIAEQPKPPPEGWLPGYTNAVVSWWKRAHPNDNPTAETLAPYLAAAAAFMATVGINIEKPQLIPWGRLPLSTLEKVRDVIASDLIDWGAVRAWLFQAVPVEAVAKVSTALAKDPPYQRDPAIWKDPTFRASIPWLEVPWSQIPFHLIPWGLVDWSGVRAALQAQRSPQAVTAEVLAALATVYGLPEPQPNESTTSEPTPGTSKPTPDQIPDQAAGRNGSVGWLFFFVTLIGAGGLAVAAGTGGGRR